MSSSLFSPPLSAAATHLATLLTSRSQTICVAETACGGLISTSLLSIPGASKFYRGGLTLYTLPSRVTYAGWTQSDIDAYTGPTPSVVRGIAENVRAKLDADWCVCESGTAGPTGGNTRNRRPGYVALAVVGAKDQKVTREVETGLGEDREGNMLAFAVEALRFVAKTIEGDVEEEGRVSEGQQEGDGKGPREGKI